MDSLPVRRLAAVWFADIVGFTRRAAENERAALRLVEVFETVARAETARHGGRVIKFIGDGALAEFSSTEAAVQAALALRDAFAARSGSTGSASSLRIGVHVGDVVQRPDGDLHGDGVNIASRLQMEAAPGQVVVSEDVWHQLRQHPEYHFEALGERELRGINARIGVFGLTGVDPIEGEEPPVPRVELDRGALAEQAPQSTHVSARRRWPHLRVYAGVAALGVLLAAGLIFARSRRPSASADGESRRVPSVQTAPVVDRSIAVLPFENLSESKENEYFSDGITDEILTRLANARGLRVISRTSVMQYKHSTKPLKQIAGELGVSNVLEGSVQRVGDRVRINAQLIDARTDAHLWAEHYDRPLEDVFAVQSEIAQQIAGTLQARLTAEEHRRMERRPTSDLTAYDLVLRGREYYDRATQQDNELAIGLFRRALEIDPGYLDAHIALADAYRLRGYVFTGDLRWLDSAVVIARRALALDPHSARAYNALGWCLDWQEKPEAARRAYEQAVALDPNLTDGLANLYQFSYGRMDEAIRLRRTALTVSPTDPILNQLNAWSFAALGLFDRAREEYERTIEVQPTYPYAYTGLADIYLVLGRPDEGRRLLRRMSEVRGEDDPIVLSAAGRFALATGDLAAARRYIERVPGAMQGRNGYDGPFLAWIYQQSGDSVRARTILREVARQPLPKPDARPGTYANLAGLRLLEHDRDGAIRVMAEAVRKGWWGYYLLPADPVLSSLRGDPRFDRLMAQVKAKLDRQRARVEREGW